MRSAPRSAAIAMVALLQRHPDANVKSFGGLRITYGTFGQPARLTRDDSKANTPLGYLWRMGPIHSDRAEPGLLLALEQLANRGQVLTERHGAVTTFYHPDERVGTGYYRNRDGQLINGGYGAASACGSFLDDDGFPIEDSSRFFDGPAEERWAA